MGNVFERMCKEFLFMKAGENDYPIITEIDNFQKIIVDENGKQRQIEIDIIGRDGKDILIVGECKFTNEKVNKEIFDSFMEKTHYIKGQNPLLCMFSLKGYTDYVVENAEGVILLTIEDLYI